MPEPIAPSPDSPEERPERDAARRRDRARRRGLAVVASVAAHVGILLILFDRPPDPPMAVEPEAIQVGLVGPLNPLAAAGAPAAAPTPAEPPPPELKVRPTPRPPPPMVKTLASDPEPPEQPAPQLSEGQVAGAATAGSGSGGGGGGGGGGGCNMLRVLQAALRKDARVQSEVAVAHNSASGKALWVWNGDWIKSEGQEGKGLAALRQAIVWEVAFSPEACRAEPVHGLVMISLNDGPGAARVVVGSGEWRWNDLVHARR